MFPRSSSTSSSLGILVSHAASNGTTYTAIGLQSPPEFVREGCCLPIFYGIYVNDLIIILQKSGIGCHVRAIFAACLFYADDIAVLAPSVKGLQYLLNLCHSYCVEWDILLNAKKTKNMFFGKGSSPSFCTRMNNIKIPWVDQWKYLGVTLKSGVKFGCCVKEKLASFYRSVNGILRIEGHADELVRLRLLEAHCLPILTYGIEVIHVSNRDDRRQLRVAYNSIHGRRGRDVRDVRVRP